MIEFLKFVLDCILWIPDSLWGARQAQTTTDDIHWVVGFISLAVYVVSGWILMFKLRDRPYKKKWRQTACVHGLPVIPALLSIVIAYFILKLFQ